MNISVHTGGISSCVIIVGFLITVSKQYQICFEIPLLPVFTGKNGGCSLFPLSQSVPLIFALYFKTFQLFQHRLFRMSFRIFEVFLQNQNTNRDLIVLTVLILCSVLLQLLEVENIISQLCKPKMLRNGSICLCNGLCVMLVERYHINAQTPLRG